MPVKKAMAKRALAKKSTAKEKIKVCDGYLSGTCDLELLPYFLPYIQKQVDRIKKPLLEKSNFLLTFSYKR